MLHTVATVVEGFMKPALSTAATQVVNSYLCRALRQQYHTEADTAVLLQAALRLCPRQRPEDVGELTIDLQDYLANGNPVPLLR